MPVEPARRLDRFRGALLGGLVGDAFGAPFEGLDTVDRAAVDDGLVAADRLRFTDDTHMSIGVAESLLACAGFDGAHLAGTFADHFWAEPWRGYGPGPPQLFAMYRQGVAWDRAASSLFSGRGSFGNGAAMRVAPAALFVYRSLPAVSQLARQTSVVTHTHELGIEGAVFQALAVALLLDEAAGTPFDVEAFLTGLSAVLMSEAYRLKLDDIRALLPDAEQQAVVRRLGNGVAAQSSVPTALYAFLRSPAHFAETICYAVSLGGDTDTIAAMAGALSGAYLGEGGIPGGLLARTEGVDLMRELADQLYAVSVAADA